MKLIKRLEAAKRTLEYVDIEPKELDEIFTETISLLNEVRGYLIVVKDGSIKQNNSVVLAGELLSLIGNNE